MVVYLFPFIRWWLVTSPLVLVNVEFFPFRPLTYGCISLSIHSLMIGYLSVGFGKRWVFPISSADVWLYHCPSSHSLMIGYLSVGLGKRWVFPHFVRWRMVVSLFPFIRWCLVTSPLVSVNVEFFPLRPLTYGCILSWLSPVELIYLSVGLGKRWVFPSCPLASSWDFWSQSSCVDVWMCLYLWKKKTKTKTQERKIPSSVQISTVLGIQSLFTLKVWQPLLSSIRVPSWLNRGSCSTSNLHPTIVYIHFILGHSITCSIA